MLDDTAGALSEVGNLDFGRLKTDPLGVIQSAYDRQFAAQKNYEQTAREQYEAAREKIAARNYGMRQSEKLFALSQALLSPKKVPGFAGAMGKLSGAFGGIAAADREARMARDAELAKLEASYRTGVAERGMASAKTAADLIKAGAPYARPRDPGVWDSARGRFVPKDRPVAVQSGVLQGRKIVSYSDGTSRLYGAGGNPKAYEVLDAAGDVIGEGMD